MVLLKRLWAAALHSRHHLKWRSAWVCGTPSHQCPIQGTADVIKGQVRMPQALCASLPRRCCCRHDELIFECPKDAADDAIALIVQSWKADDQCWICRATRDSIRHHGMSLSLWVLVSVRQILPKWSSLCHVLASIYGIWIII